MQTEERIAYYIHKVHKKVFGLTKNMRMTYTVQKMVIEQLLGEPDL